MPTLDRHLIVYPRERKGLILVYLLSPPPSPRCLNAKLVDVVPDVALGDAQFTGYLRDGVVDFFYCVGHGNSLV